jgi:hypothetical protein
MANLSSKLRSLLKSPHVHEKDVTKGELFEAHRDAYRKKLHECGQSLETLAPKFEAEEANIFQEAKRLCETASHQCEANTKARVDLYIFSDLVSACEIMMCKCMTQASKCEAEADEAGKAHEAEIWISKYKDMASLCRDEVRKHKLEILSLEHVVRTCRIEADEEADDARMHTAKANECKDMTHNYKMMKEEAVCKYLNVACVEEDQVDACKVELNRRCGQKACCECGKIIEEIEVHADKARAMKKCAIDFRSKAYEYKWMADHFHSKAVTHERWATVHQTEARQCKEVADICDTKILAHQSHVRRHETAICEYEAKVRELKAQVQDVSHEHGKDNTTYKYAAEAQETEKVRELKRQIHICTSKASEWRKAATAFEVYTREFQNMACEYKAYMCTPPIPPHPTDEQGCIN